MNTYKIIPKTFIYVGAITGIFILKYAFSRMYYWKKRYKEVIIISNLKEWYAYEEKIIQKIVNSKVIGMDCEWVTGDNDKRKPIALLQLANDDGFCILIRLCRFTPWLMPPSLEDLLRDSSILKVGVAIYDDAKMLLHDYCLNVYGIIDLRYLVQDLPEMQGKTLSLKSLSEEILKFNLSKNQSLRCSDWEANNLTCEQIGYAANDALVSAQIFSEIRKRKESSQDELNFESMIQNYIDLPFKQGNKNKFSTKQPSNKVPNKTSRYSKPRQRPMYDNCKLEAPDGEILCNCDKNKANWYIEKGLGEIINEEPLTVRLNFEPSGRPILDNAYYTKTKENCCVVCGKDENYYRKQIVPAEYRKYFPNIMKKNLSHDIVILCVECHKKSNILDTKFRLKLAKECNAPLCSGQTSKYKINHELVRVKSSANALLTQNETIPIFRRKELTRNILEYFNVNELTMDILKQALNLEVMTLNEDYIPHGLKVYQHACKNGGLIQFEKRWRQHFLDTMKPKFLPVMWSVEHNHQRLALQVKNRSRKIDFDISILGLTPDFLEETSNENQNNDKI